MLKILNQSNSLLNTFIAEIRDINIQNDRMRFRRNLERIGEIIAYEISKTFDYSEKEVQTPLGIANINLPQEEVVIGTILRAGLPLHQGFLNYFDKAENSFITAYRKYRKDESFDIKIEYISTPNIEDKTLILVDPMLASGASMMLALKELLKYGTPKHIHIAAIISSNEAVEYLKRNITGVNYTIWSGAVDMELTAKSYIVPGLGDAGDLAYGNKN